VLVKEVLEERPPQAREDDQREPLLTQAQQAVEQVYAKTGDDRL